jgi:hypothetical protein
LSAAESAAEARKPAKAEQTASRVRLGLFGLVVILLLVAVSGQHFAQALLQQLKDVLRPIKVLSMRPSWKWSPC